MFLVIVVLGGSAYITLDKLVFNKTYQEMETIVLNVFPILSIILILQIKIDMVNMLKIKIHII